jgi:hypothetical protein
LYGRGWVLLRIGAEAPDTTALERAAAERRVPLEVIVVTARDAVPLYQRRLVLVRPDGHVAWRADQVPADSAALIDQVRGAVPAFAANAAVA